MPRAFLDVMGMALVLGALGLLFLATRAIADRDLLGSALLIIAGLGTLNAAMELLGPSVGE